MPKIIDRRSITKTTQYNVNEYKSRTKSNLRLGHVPIFSRTFELRFSLGTFRIRFVTPTCRDRTLFARRIDLRQKPRVYQLTLTFLPCMVLSTVLNFTLGCQYNSLRAGIQTFNLRPTTTPIFESCSLGDIDNVRMLIMQGKASPQDVDPDGWTLLHVRAS